MKNSWGLSQEFYDTEYGRSAILSITNSLDR